MIKFILRHSNCILTDDELYEIYKDSCGFAIPTETSYKAWKYDRLESGAIKFYNEVN